MRLFIGIELEDAVKEYLYNVQDALKPHIISGDFTNYSNFHLTIKYIGHTDDEDIELLESSIDYACKNIEKFNISLNGLKSFNKGKNEILFIALNKGIKEVSKVFELIEKHTVALGFDENTHKKYRPHITIGKKVQFKTGKTNDILPAYYPNIEVKKLTLFHSHRISGILKYDPIYSKEFN